MPAPRLLDDSPIFLTANDPSKPVAQALRSLIVDAVMSKRHVRIGLFGGFGQGKTSVVKSALLNVPGKVRVVAFDASLYPAATLEFDFHRFVALWGLFRSLLAWLVVGFLAFALVLALILELDFFWVDLGKQSLGLALLTTFARAMHALLPHDTLQLMQSEIKRRRNLGVRWARFLVPLIRKPNLLWVDDLDRATLDQQRAVLRALYKLSDDLNLSVIVCMDDAPLLDGETKSEQPPELLRKVIQCELRLPARDECDAPFLAHGLLRNAASANSPHEAILRHPLVAADFAVVAALVDVSPRVLKRILNDTLAHAHRLGRWSPLTLGALFRLHGAYAIAPRLREEGAALIVALDVDSGEAYDTLARVVTSGDSRLARFMRRTRALRPYDQDFGKLVGASGPRTPDPSVAPAVEPFADLRSRNTDRDYPLYANLNHAFAALALGYGERMLRDVINEKLSDSALCRVASLVDLWTVAVSVVARFDILDAGERVRSWFERELDRRSGDSSLPEDEAKAAELLRFALLRSRWGEFGPEGDEQIAGLLSKTDKTVKQFGQKLYLLRLGGAGRLDIGQALHAVYLGMGQDSPGRVLRQFQAWLAQFPISDKAVSMLPGYAAPSGTNEAADRAWPVPTEETVVAHCRLLAWAHAHGITARPVSLANFLWDDEWIKRYLEQGCVQRVATIIDALLRGGGRVDFGAWAAFGMMEPIADATLKMLDGAAQLEAFASDATLVALQVLSWVDNDRRPRIEQKVLDLGNRNLVTLTADEASIALTLNDLELWQTLPPQAAQVLFGRPVAAGGERLAALLRARFAAHNPSVLDALGIPLI